MLVDIVTKKGDGSWARTIRVLKSAGVTVLLTLAHWRPNPWRTVTITFVLSQLVTAFQTCFTHVSDAVCAGNDQMTVLIQHLGKAVSA